MRWSVILLLSLASMGLAQDGDLHGSTAAARSRAIDAIAAQGPLAINKLDAVAKCLEDTDLSVRVHALKAIGAVGGVDAVPLLRMFASSKYADPPLRSAAQRALKSIGPLPPDRVAWGDSGSQYQTAHGELFRLTNSDFAASNSRRVTLEQARRQVKEHQLRGGTTTIGGWMTDLPTVAIGSYGFVRSMEVAQVLGPTEMLVRFSAVLEPPTLIWLSGYDTSGIRDGQQWGRVFVAIIGTTQYVDVSGSKRTVLQAVSLSTARRGIGFPDHQKLVGQAAAH